MDKRIDGVNQRTIFMINSRTFVDLIKLFRLGFKILHAALKIFVNALLFAEWQLSLFLDNRLSTSFSVMYLLN